MTRAFVELLPAARLFVGARFVCTKCKTRGVTPKCTCGAKNAAVDLTAPAQAALLKELTSPPASPGAPTREELFWGGLKSPTQWLLSGLVGVVVALMIASDGAWTLTKLGYLLAEVVLLTLLFRLPMLAVELALRLVVTTLSLLVAAGCFIAGAIARSRRIEAAARNWLARAEQVLNGEYFWRRSMVELLAPPALSEVEYRGALLPSGDLRALVAIGKHGALALSDADVPPFNVVLASGETIVVSIETGTLSVAEAEIGAEDAGPVLPLLPETRAWQVAAASSVTLQGGEWSESDQGAGYRAPLEPRTLRGTLDRPLVASIG